MGTKRKADSVTDALDDLAVAYIMHMPQSEYTSPTQLCYAFQKAHWDYLDHSCTNDPTLPKFKFTEFVSNIVNRVPGLESLQPMVADIVAAFRRHNAGVPAYGAILLNKARDKVLLCQSQMANGKGGAWSWPRGKMEQVDNGDRFACARREVWEETAYDIGEGGAEAEARYVERQIFFSMAGSAGDEERVCKTVGLFIVPDVDESFPFFAHTLGEVAAFAWFKVADLPRKSKGGKELIAGDSAAPVKFYHVQPFMGHLLSYVKSGSGARGQGRQQAQPRPIDDANDPLGFDEMIKLNEELVKHDRTPVYEGVRPAYQLKALSQRDKLPRAGRALDFGGAAAWSPVQVALPVIKLQTSFLQACCPSTAVSNTGVTSPTSSSAFARFCLDKSRLLLSL